MNFTKKKKRISTLFILLMVNTFTPKLNSQTKTAFDFWVGSWNASWNDSIRGTNKITKTLNNKIIEEQFSFNDKSFTGKSWTVYDSISKTWKQTWVDNSGAYLAFIGGKSGDNMILNLVDKQIKKNKAISLRMVFYNIKKNSFDWDWQSSEDDKNWKSTWLISYTRID